MCNGKHVMETFSKLLLSWEICALDSSTLSVGLVSCLNPLVASSKPYKIVGVILMEGRFIGSYQDLTILKYFGCYREREIFWKSLVSIDTLGS